MHSKLIITVSFILLFMVAGTGYVHGNIPQKEREALIALYNSTNGDNWTDNSGWKEDPLDTDGFAMPGTEEYWYGVYCDEGNTMVLWIYLDNNNLDGIIPAELGNLSNLSYLYLESNKLEGSIPRELGDLSDLGILSLSSNQLTGSIPRELGNLSNLYILYLYSNQLTGSIPRELGNLSNLGTLDLSYNQVTGIPSELGNLSDLDTLNLPSNQLTGSIPPELGNLSDLDTLDLSDNQLTGIPPELGNLEKLSILYLNSNRFERDGFSNITSFTSLDDNKSDFRWNALSIDDESVRTFLNEKQVGGQWENTQTVAPKDVSARTISATSVEVSWTPIAYFSDNGGYMVFYSRTPGGPYDDWHLFDITGRKTDSRLVVTGLDPLTPYYFVVKTRTESHYNNPNTLESEYSKEVSADTLGSDKIISGRVTTETGKGVEGVTLIFISLPSEEKEVEITDRSGNYSRTVKYGWEGTVEPSKPGFSFDPSRYVFENVTSNQPGKNFTAKQFASSISGKVTSAGEGVKDVILTFSADSGETETMTTKDDGLYSYEVSYGWTGRVTPSKGSLLFYPAYIAYGGPGILGNRDHQNYELSVSLILNVSREGDRTLILRKEYGKIELGVDIIGPFPAALQKFVIYRKEPGGTYQQNQEFIVQEHNNSYEFTYEDKYLDKAKTYTYIARALDANDNVIGESKEKTIQPL